MILDTKFRTAFLYPLLFSVITSFIIVLILLISFSNNYNNKDLVSALEEKDKQKTNPLFLSVNNILFEKFQKAIYCLYLIKKHFDLNRHIIQNYNKNLNNSSSNVNLNYNSTLFINALDLYNYKEEMSKRFQSPKNLEKILDYAFWFVDPNITSTDEILKRIKNSNYTTSNYQNLYNELIALHYTLPMIRASFESMHNGLKEGDLISPTYFASGETNLFFGYPLDIEFDKGNKNQFAENNTFLKNFKWFEFSPDCLDKNGNKPNYYYFQCRDWWNQIIEEFKPIFSNITEKIIISSPYKFLGQMKYGITTCLAFNNEYSQSDVIEEKISTFCLDLDISDIQLKFDDLNKQISGYFYILKVNSNYPIYYPYLTPEDYFSNLERLEFDMMNKYYITELSDFSLLTIKSMSVSINNKDWKKYLMDSAGKQTLNTNFNTSYNSESYKKIETNLNGVYFKNQKEINYIITPVFFHDNLLNEDENSHLLSIIYVFENTVISMNLNSFVQSLFPRFLLQILFYFLLIVILIEVSWHLITTIGYNIVRPIKNLKFQIKGMNAENTDFDKKLFGRKSKNAKNNTNTIYDEDSISSTNEPVLHKNSGFKKFSNIDFRNTAKNLKSDFYQDAENASKLEKIKSFNKIEFKRLDNNKKKEYHGLTNSNPNSDDSFSEELDEDDLGIISSEMSGLFNTVIELKNTISFTLDKDNKHDSQSLIKYLKSVHMFSKVQNSSAEKISESNLGSILLNFRKFNYAVLHLKKCLINEENAHLEKLSKQLNMKKNSLNGEIDYNNENNYNNLNDNFDINDIYLNKPNNFHSKDHISLNEKNNDKGSILGKTSLRNYTNNTNNNNININNSKKINLIENLSMVNNNDVNEKISPVSKKWDEIKRKFIGGKKSKKDVEKKSIVKISFDIQNIKSKDLLEYFIVYFSRQDKEIKDELKSRSLGRNKQNTLNLAKKKKSMYGIKVNESNRALKSSNSLANNKNYNFNNSNAQESNYLQNNLKNYLQNSNNNYVDNIGNLNTKINEESNLNKDIQKIAPKNSNSLDLKSRTRLNTKNQKDNMINKHLKEKTNEMDIYLKNNNNETSALDNNDKNLSFINTNNPQIDLIKREHKVVINTKSKENFGNDSLSLNNNIRIIYNSNMSQKENISQKIYYSNILSVETNRDMTQKSEIPKDKKAENADNYEFSDLPIFNIKSRYPKLIHSFKIYFKSIRKLIKDNNFNKAKFLEDILVLSKHINLEQFEKVILLYLHESSIQKNLIRQMEAILEYIEFLIIYKLKIVLVMEERNNEYLDSILYENHLSNVNFINSTNEKNKKGNRNIAMNENNNLANNNNLSSNSNNAQNNNYNHQTFNNNYNFFKSKNQEKILFNRTEKDVNNVKEYLQRIKNFISYFDVLKQKFLIRTNCENFKNFLEILTEKRIDDLDLTEIPYTVLIMRLNFLKGKLAKICGHYYKALNYFYISREYLTICDAWIIKKSNKNIKQIYELIFKKIENDLFEIENANSDADLNRIEKKYFNYDAFGCSEISNHMNNSIINNKINKNFINLDFNNINKYNNKNLNILNSNIKVPKTHFYKNQKNNINHNNGQKIYNNDHDVASIGGDHHSVFLNNNLKTKTIQDKIEIQKSLFLKYKQDIKEKITLIDKELDSFIDYNKDLIVLVDISNINNSDIKKYENLLKLSLGFYENYVCLGDRFGIFLCLDTITPLIPFEKKLISNYLFTKNNINNHVKNLDNFSYIADFDISNHASMQICKTILHTYEYLNKKWNFENEKWIIIFSFNLSIDSENLRQKIQNENVIKKYINLIIIGIDYDSSSITKAKEFIKLFGEKSYYIGDDDVGSLKSIFRKKSLQKEKHFFPFEIYRTRKSNNLNSFRNNSVN